VLVPQDHTTNGVVLMNDRTGNFRTRTPIQLPPGTFGPGQIVEHRHTMTFSAPRASVQVRVVPIDLDGDAFQDLAILDALNDASNLVYYRGSRIQLLVNQNGTGFVDETSARGAPGSETTRNFDSYHGNLWVFDVDADGFADLVVERLNVGEIENHVFLNDGDGHFTRSTVSGLPTAGALIPLDAGPGRPRRIASIQKTNGDPVNTPGGVVHQCQLSVQAFAAAR
jgi:hypothetical protein